MEKTVLFRDFDDRDIDFIYKCKNDEKLNSLTVGGFKKISYEEAVRWVQGCKGEHDTYKFWAVCTNDDEKRIVGWVSLSEIDYTRKSALFHGIVIGDQSYKDGFAWIEAYLFIYEYVFEHLRFDSLYGSAIESQISTLVIREVMFCQQTEVRGNAVLRNGKYYDVSFSVIKSSDYFMHKKLGDYEMLSILKRMRKVIRSKKQ